MPITKEEVLSEIEKCKNDVAYFLEKYYHPNKATKMKLNRYAEQLLPFLLDDVERREPKNRKDVI